MGFFSGSPATSTTNQTSTSSTSYNPSPFLMNQWQNVQGTASGLADWARNNSNYQGERVAAPDQLMSQYWQQAGSITGAPDTSQMSNMMGNVYNATGQQMRDPNAINLPSNFNFQPGQINLPQFGNVPQVGMPSGGPSGLASSYMWNPMQVQGPTVQTPQGVSAMMVQAPGRVDPISGLMQVSAPQLQQYQMAQAERVQAPGDISSFQINPAANMQAAQVQAAPDVQAGTVNTQSFTQPGTSQSYMSPYMQNVVDTQKTRAVEDYNQQLQTTRSQAAQSGAFGGTRQAVVEATQARDLQDRMNEIQAQGLQGAFQQAQQQFNQEQQLGLQSQQSNVQSGLQAALANQQVGMQTGLANQQTQQQANMTNQQMQQQALLANQQAALQAQGLGTQTGLQAALANQAAGINVGGQNLQALLQTQGLGSGQNMQAQLANQQQGWQQALANQQAQEFGLGQQMQASLANQQAGLQADINNYQGGLQAALANAGYNMQGQMANQSAGMQMNSLAQQLGFQGAQANAGYGMQAALANQAAGMQALGAQYQGGLQSALQTQNLGFQGQTMAGQLGLQSAQQQEALRQSQMGMNLNALGQQGQTAQGMGNLALNTYGQGLQGLQALQQGATSQQGYAQQRADAAYSNWLMSNMLPMQATSWQAQLLGMNPMPSTTTGYNNTQGTTTSMGAQGSLLGQLLGSAIGIGGMFLRKGGPVKADAIDEFIARMKAQRQPSGLETAYA